MLCCAAVDVRFSLPKYVFLDRTKTYVWTKFIVLLGGTRELVYNVEEVRGPRQLFGRMGWAHLTRLAHGDIATVKRPGFFFAVYLVQVRTIFSSLLSKQHEKA